MRSFVVLVGVAAGLLVGCGDQDPGVDLAKKNLCRPFQIDDDASTLDADELIEDFEHAALLFEGRGELELALAAWHLAETVKDRPHPLLTVYLDDDASEDEVTSVRDQLEDANDVVSVEYVSKEDAFDEYVEGTKDRPELHAHLDPGALPAMLRAQVDNARILPALATQMQEDNPSVVDDARYSNVPGGGFDRLASTDQLAVAELCFSTFFEGY